jgi:heptosyltransferase II
MSTGQPSSTPRRILVRGVNWLGDAVMTTPALLRLHEKFPESHITLLTPEKLRDLWLHHPAVNETISFAAGDNPISIGKKLRTGNFDLALVLPNSPRSALEVWMGKIPLRIGYARPWRNLLLTIKVPPRSETVKMRKRTPREIRDLIRTPKTQTLPPSSSHHVYEYLHLASALGASAELLRPQLFVTTEEIEAVRSELSLEDTKYRRPFFGVNAGAEYGRAKRWPVEKFIETIQAVQQRAVCNWIIFGGPGDVRLAYEIERALDDGSSIFNRAGQTSLRELMAAMKLCRVLLTNDTGPMHVAAALGTPVVVPFGSTSPELTGPGAPGDARHHLIKSDAPCSPCFLRKCPIDFRCMNGITVERVVEAVMKAAA